MTQPLTPRLNRIMNDVPAGALFPARAQAGHCMTRVALQAIRNRTARRLLRDHLRRAMAVLVSVEPAANDELGPEAA